MTCHAIGLDFLTGIWCSLLINVKLDLNVMLKVLVHILLKIVMIVMKLSLKRK